MHQVKQLYTNIQWNVKTRKSKIVGMLIHEKFEANMDSIRYVSDWFLQVALTTENKQLHIVFVYAPDITKSREEKIAFYEQLHHLIEDISP